jgi:phosphohistidine swiveling domain-containing protein
LFHFIRNIEDQPVGGKARGLKVLKELGLKVPESFVIIHPNGYDLPEDILAGYLNDLGHGPKAVRSSAVSEDGYHASFAGQFESYLNVSGTEAVKAAIRKCVDAAYSDRVSLYSENIHHKADTRISVIVQNMVEADMAGVIFSADPVSNRRDKMMINVAGGAGDDLVSGKKDSVQYLVFRSGKNIDAQIAQNGDMLSTAQIRELMEGTKKAEKAYGYPVDLEWAIDSEGVIHWLQVRPVTTLDDIHFNELDDVKEESTDVWSLGNIGEMMPGVVTPLTYSVSGRTIDIGLGYLAARSGVIPMKDIRKWQSLELFYNRLFFNMSKYMIYARKLAQNRKENILISLSAKDVPELVVGKMDPAILRYLRLIKQITTIQFAGRSVKKILKLEKNFRLPMTGDLHKDYETLNYAFERLVDAFCYHNLSSAQSGYYYSVLMGILTGNKRPPEAKDHYLCALLLADNPDIESADAVKSLERFADLLRGSAGFAEEFSAMTTVKALKLLQDHAPAPIRASYNSFLERHGHRCVRESELREKPWEEDQEQLISMIQASLKAGKRSKSTRDNAAELRQLMAEQLTPARRFFINLFKNASRKAVSNREMTKAYCMKMVNKTRKAYRKYAKTLVEHGLLDDTDQIYFLTREEIGQVIEDRNPAWKTKTNKRRAQLPETAKLQFPLMNIGIPEPLEEEETVTVSGSQMKGIPVSSGVVKARARIINSLDEAGTVQKGEIMVVSFTDIGWTPYFSLVSGLITEIGSPLSHGAVVAREYGIPAMVSAKGARNFIKTGDLVLLDGSRGTVEVLYEH